MSAASRLAAGEVWRWVPGLEQQYQASSLGRIRSVDRTVTHKTGHRYRLRGAVLHPAVPRGRKYMTVQIFCRTRPVHELVLLAFAGPRPPGMEARHLDGNRLNNRPDNLEWNTRLVNLRDIVRHGTHNHARKTRCIRGHLLAGANLAPTSRQRKCLSCARALSRCASARRRGIALSVDEVADLNYQNLGFAS